MILKPAVQTAKYAKYAKGNGVEWTRTFTRWEDLSPLLLIRSASAWFACFAVPSAFSRMNLPLLNLDVGQAFQPAGLPDFRMCLAW
jgi:hypothetical protein